MFLSPVSFRHLLKLCCGKKHIEQCQIDLTVTLEGQIQAHSDFEGL